jgi:4-hydroxy-tetrahydrodipicolinate synthase
MSTAPTVTGVYCAAATPVTDDLSPDTARFTAHCRWLLDEGCDGIALLGTTGEANSFSIPERRALLEATIAAGIAADRLLPGVGLPAIPDTVELTRAALGLGVTRVVMLPPFYYKGVSEDGLFAAYSEVIQHVGDSRLQILLYHIPQMSGVPITAELIARLVAAYPETIVGIKDSAGDFDKMRALVERFPGFSVLAGADPLLLPLLGAGGAGCITATSNLVARDLKTVFTHYADPSQRALVDKAQARIIAHRTLSNSLGAQIPTIKVMLAARHGAESWANTRPPLVPLTPDQRRSIAGALQEIA